MTVSPEDTKYILENSVSQNVIGHKGDLKQELSEFKASALTLTQMSPNAVRSNFRHYKDIHL